MHQIEWALSLSGCGDRIALRHNLRHEIESGVFLGGRIGLRSKAMDLTGKQRRFLRAQAHALKPKVWVGKQGVVPNLVGQVDASLTSHELIKVKLLEACPLRIAECADALVTATGAALAQTIGRTILLYRPHPDRPVLKLPGSSPAAGLPEAPSATPTPASSRES